MTETLRLPAALLAHAAGPYRSAGLHPWLFAHGKLRGDPVFAGLLRLGLIPSHSRLLDLGCGQGLLAALLHAAAADPLAWPNDWPEAPREVVLHGIDQAARDVRWARIMAASRGGRGAPMDFVQADIRRLAFGEQDVVVLLDVLHYLAADEQERLLARVRDCLVPGGRLLVRVADARAGVGFAASLVVDRLVLAMRRVPRLRLHGRPLAEWQLLLQSLGFALQTHPMHAGTPFANLLLVGQLDRSTEPSKKTGCSSMNAQSKLPDSEAVIVFAHGSRDPLWRQPVEAVAQRVRELQPAAAVACAYLEMSEPDLIQAADALIQGGARRVVVLPLFIGVGKHAREDLPRLIDQLALAHPDVVISVRPAVGEDPGLIDAMARLAIG